MSIPFARRRVKIAPEYVGISISKKTVILPHTVRANASELSRWTQTASVMAGLESDNDSEASTSEEERHTDMESELETDREESSRRKPQRPDPMKPLGLSTDFSDVVFENDLEFLVSQWTPKERDQNRKVIRLGRDEDDGAVSLWQSSSDSAALSISCLANPSNRDYFVTLHDLQRLLAFITGASLTDPIKKRLHRWLDLNGWRRLEQPESALSKSISQLTAPLPVLRRTSQLWVLAWDQLGDILTTILTADGVCVTFLS